MSIPRTLLLTWWAPDTRYKVMQKIVACLPPERVGWCSLWPCRPESRVDFRHQAFAPRQLHWRLRGTAWNYYYSNELQAERIARQVAEWAAAWRPEIIWVLPELGAASVAFHLRRLLGLPVHATVHDAHETALSMVPALYYPFYARSVRRLLDGAKTVDAISAGMLAYLERGHANITASNSMVFHPSVPEAVAAGERAGTGPDINSDLRRIGFCGSMRTSRRQWRDFLTLLESLPLRFEIVAFAYEDLFHDVPLPGNVRVRAEAFAATEADVIRGFHAAGVQACYLGLWRESRQRLFAQTSLSAKLATYAAAGLPVVVDGPADSAAWHLVEQYGAGVLCENDRDAARQGLNSVLSDPETWQRMAQGARRLCLEQFNLEQNIERFKQLLCRTAS